MSQSQVIIYKIQLRKIITSASLAIVIASISAKGLAKFLLEISSIKGAADGITTEVIES
jgi:hypothetical protein